MIRVASYNIQKAIGLDARRRPRRILEVIAEIDPDILALQEADRRFGPRECALPREMIDQLTDYAVVPLSTRDRSIGWHGNAILVRRSIRIRGQKRVALPSFDPRGAVIAELEVQGRHMRVIATHLSLFKSIRARQLEILFNMLDLDEDCPPSVILGDLNEWRRSVLGKRAREAQYRVATTGPSFPALVPLANLDRIIVSSGLSVGEFGVHRSPKARIASDHLPVWAALSFSDDS